MSAMPVLAGAGQKGKIYEKVIATVGFGDYHKQFGN
jgi:hypothetical protein